MAVDASHLNLLHPQLIHPNRDFAFSNHGGIPLVPAMAADGMFPAVHQSMAQPKTSLNTTDSGLTHNLCPRKRQRDSFNTGGQPSIGDNLLPYIQQYDMDIDTIIFQHTKKIRLELAERQRQQARVLMSAIGEGVVKKLREKDEQIQRMGKINLALQERVKSLYVENQLWRDLAQSNEAAANSLRNNLEHVLAHVADERLPGGAPAEDDAESCCGSNDHRGGAREEDGQGNSRNRMCKGCGERESCVLLLPCRHLCLCTICGSTLLRTCPVCSANMDATVHVNLPS